MKKAKTSNMFEFVTHTCNRVGGICSYACKYCWAKQYAKRFKYDKYKGEAKYCPDAVMNEIKGESDYHLEPNSFVFEGTMRDLMAPEVKTEWLIDILESIEQTEESKFLILTKNPLRFLDLMALGISLPQNLILGVTIESNRNYPTLSNAPPQSSRIEYTHRLKKYTKNQIFIAVEPILKFDISSSLLELIVILEVDKRLFGIAVGYDNYNHKLPEPPLSKTQSFIDHLKHQVMPVGWLCIKTLRKAWYEV